MSARVDDGNTAHWQLEQETLIQRIAKESDVGDIADDGDKSLPEEGSEKQVLTDEGRRWKALALKLYAKDASVSRSFYLSSFHHTECCVLSDDGG